MVDAAKIRAAVESYIAAFDNDDIDAIIALYADECSVEDPVGTTPVVGIEAVRAFYERSMKAQPRLTLQPPIRVAGNETAFAFTGVVNTPEGKLQFDVIDHMIFNEDGKIRQMRAIFGPDNMKPVQG